MPEMQRGYVWTKDQVKDLFDSIYRGYPTGSILLWDQAAEGATQKREAAIKQDRANIHKKLLLDGQQRLTSLCAVITGEQVLVGGRETTIDIMFNMEHPDVMSWEEEDENEDLNTNASLEKEIFAVKAPELTNRSNWISVKRAFSADFHELLKKELKGKPSSYVRKIEELKKITARPYHVEEISSKTPYAEIVKIFVRINSKGTKLKGSDLALAQITAIWPSTAGKDGAFRMIDKYTKKLKANKHYIDKGIVIRNLVAFAANQGSLSTLPSRSDLQKNWAQAEEWMDTAIDFITNYVGLESLELLSSHFSLITVAKCLCAKHQIDKEKLKSWVILANLKGRYSLGSSVTWLSRDIGYADDIESMLKSLKAHVGRFKIESSDLSEKFGKNNAYIKILYFILKKEGAKDWCSKEAISWSTMSKKNKLESHHIFPQSKLKSHLDEDDSKTIHNIANLAFITSECNKKRLHDRLPEEYLPEIDTSILEKHLIPLDPDLWKIDNYPRFLKERQRLIAEKMNSYLKIDALEASLEE